jgi:hypothetical protein
VKTFKSRRVDYHSATAGLNSSAIQNTTRYISLSCSFDQSHKHPAHLIIRKLNSSATARSLRQKLHVFTRSTNINRVFQDQKSVLNSFRGYLSPINEVKKISYDINNGFLDINVIFESSNPFTRLEIYQRAQEVLAYAYELHVNLDFHTTNLLDYDKEQQTFILNSNANMIFVR